MDGAPAGSNVTWHPSGWIQTDIFTNGSIILFSSLSLWQMILSC